MVALSSDSDFNSLDTICEWLNDGTSPEDLIVETERPWARTYRLGGPEGPRFLKDVPPSQAEAIAALPLLSACFPEHIPHTVAVDESRGLILLDDHGGIDLDRHPTDEQKRQILVTYARLQAGAASSAELMSCLPRLNLSSLIPTLLRFLDPTAAGRDLPARARDFFSKDRCQYYYELIDARASRLSELIERADCLPLTINHCDLRARNAAARDNGDLVIYDWDEAVAAPAGLSLHKSFSGCYAPCEMLLDPMTAMTKERSKYRLLLAGYLQTLAAHDYGDERRLNTGLPGAMCAGVVHYLLSYSRFVPSSESYREDIAGILRKRLNDLLRLGDLLHLYSRDQAFGFVADYVRRDRPDHARRVIDGFTERNPTDAEAAARLCDLLSQSDVHVDDVHAVFQRHLQRHPDHCSVLHNYGIALLHKLELDAAVRRLTQAVEYGAADDTLALALDEAIEYRNVCLHADRSGQVPTIRVSEYEQLSGTMRPVRKQLAVQLYREYGTLLIENALPEASVRQMYEEYLDSYRDYFQDDRPDDALRVGNQRYMITVELKDAFNSPAVYANPHVVPIVQEILGGRMIMGGFVSTCSLPGSGNMKVHKDHVSLFPETDDPDSLPSFAVTAVVPMLGFNHEVGTTRVYKRSHNCSSEVAKKMESQDPTGPRGSILLMDYRLTHQGRANRSKHIRPILTMIYHRPWFRDIKNYGEQDPLLISDEAWNQIPAEHRHLFEWSRQGRHNDQK